MVIQDTPVFLNVFIYLFPQNVYMLTLLYKLILIPHDNLLKLFLGLKQCLLKEINIFTLCFMNLLNFNNLIINLSNSLSTIIQLRILTNDLLHELTL